MCLPTWLGPLISYLDITYGSGVLSPTFSYLDSLWVSLMFDGFIASGIVWFINTVQDWFETNSPGE
jgi:ABC-type polysaccharide/polyol phosphate export permease